jgi:hypothetical protein
MKLVRYGNPGKEKPGLIDADGKLRDLSSVVPDIGPGQLGQVGLTRIRKANPAKLPLVRGNPASAARWPTCPSSSPSA